MTREDDAIVFTYMLMIALIILIGTMGSILGDYYTKPFDGNPRVVCSKWCEEKGMIFEPYVTRGYDPYVYSRETCDKRCVKGAG